MASEHDLDQKTRSGIAYISTISCWLIIAFIVYRYGDKTEILTLIIGLISGSIGTVLALYFGGVINPKPKTPTIPGQTTTEVNMTTTEPTPIIEEK